MRRARDAAGALAHGWVLTRPAFGFGQPETRTYDTWRDAHAALAGPEIGPAGSWAERQVAGYVPGMAGYWGRSTRPRWIDAHHPHTPAR